MSKMVLSMGKTNRKSIRKSKKHSLLPLYIIIPFLAFFSYMYIYGALSPTQVLGVAIGFSPKANYETFMLSFEDDIPLEMQDVIKNAVKDIQFEGKNRFEFVQKGKYVVKKSNDIKNTIYFKQYIPVGHMYWIKNDIKNINEQKSIYVLQKDLDTVKYIVDEKNLIVTDDILGSLKGSEERIGLISIEDLTAQYKVLHIDGKYPLHDSSASFTLGFTLEGKKDLDFVSHILSKNLELKYGISNSLDENTLVKINMGGVVAMSRGLASKMDSTKNYEYPAQSIGKFLADADLTHVSNEVSFVEGCTGYTGMSFCSKPQTIESLKASGVDIVELTGNHNNDYGSKNNTKSIEIYKALGWDYFGGGLDITDASKILYKEVKGSTIAFIGYNYYDSMQKTAAIATNTHAGANSYSVEKLTNDINTAKQSADVVIVTFQFQECYSYPSSDVVYPICYKPLASPDQKGVFRQAIDLGADIVVGTQAHQPQTYEVYNGGYIFYGLGNLYFDQYRWIGTRQGLILSIYIQEGNLLQVKLTPILMGTDLIPKIATPKDGDYLLELLKSARTF